MKKVNILGTDWEIEIKNKADDKYLETADGYCDKTSKTIIIGTEPIDSELDNFKKYQDKVLRHEIIHAFLFESGLQENFEHKQFGHDETYVDWFAVQFPKILKVYQELECL